MNKRYGILIVSVTIFVLCFVGTASATNWSVDDSGGADFTGIQDAINNASDGDTIIVHSGVYYENVVVNKSVTLIGNGQPVVDAGGEGNAIMLCADGITLVGFNATNSGRSWIIILPLSGCTLLIPAGINVISNNNTITGNNVCNNGEGIHLSHSRNNTITGNNVHNNNLYGISLSSSSNDSITGNNFCNNNDGGILLSGSNNNTLTGNNVSNNNEEGIELESSSNNTITGNTFVNDGLSVDDSYQNIVEDNTVNGKPLVYLEDASNYTVEDAGQVILVNCTNITVENLNLSNVSDGVQLWKTEDSKVLNNTANNNGYGIYLSYSNNNTLTGNNASNNNAKGISLYSSSNNTITGNNVSNNNEEGIELYYSSNNSIKGNNASNNNREGIELSYSSNNIITGNNVSNNNEEGICLHYSSNNNTITGNTFVNDGLSVSSSYQNTVEDNTVNGKPLVYLEDASDYTVEDAGQVILVNCTNITVENLDLSNVSDGVQLWKTEDSKVLNNTANNNGYGIYLSYSNNNTITGNKVSNNSEGIELYDSRNNIITGNNASNNSNGGIFLSSSSNNTITGNNVRNNRDGIQLYDSRNNIITGNNASNNSNGGIFLSSSSNNNITGNNISNHRDGIVLYYSSNNNTITGNNASNNREGIELYYSSKNKIYFNNFINNTHNVHSYETNIWNSPLEITYTYDGNAYTHYLGNYWSNYKGTDAEGDGIGDTHYSIDTNGDKSDDYPLMDPFENYVLTTSALA